MEAPIGTRGKQTALVCQWTMTREAAEWSSKSDLAYYVTLSSTSMCTILLRPPELLFCLKKWAIEGYIPYVQHQIFFGTTDSIYLQVKTTVPPRDFAETILRGSSQFYGSNAPTFSRCYLIEHTRICIIVCQFFSWGIRGRFRQIK